MEDFYFPYFKHSQFICDAKIICYADNISYKKIAENTNYSYSAISSYMAGRRKSIRTAVAIANYLGIDAHKYSTVRRPSS